MARKTKADALKTRQHLIETAIMQFAVRGVSNTTLNDIADAASVTRGRSIGILKIRRNCSMRYGYNNLHYAILFRINLLVVGVIILYSDCVKSLWWDYNILHRILASRH